MSVIKKIRRHGIVRSLSIAWHLTKVKIGYIDWRHRADPKYSSPSPQQLVSIEKRLVALGIEVRDYAPDPNEFLKFQRQALFPANYHGGSNSSVWTEKLLEHWISQQMLSLKSFGSEDIYVDIAAASSPWANIQRDAYHVNAFANDLAHIGEDYSHLDYYRIEDATRSSFSDSSVSGASLHCAFEMFGGDADTRLVAELARILKPGASAIILPLYMHTHYCTYSSPEYFQKGFSDHEAKEYVRLDCRGVPSSRKYSPEALKRRVLDPIQASGLRYRLHVLRNKNQFGAGIYCHFILEIIK